MKDFPKWQFCKITHSPFFVALDIARKAGAPCPWPKDIIAISYDFLFISFANRNKLWRGSAPTDRINTKGTLFEISSKISFIVGVNDSTKYFPKIVPIYSVIASTVDYGFITFVNKRVWKSVISDYSSDWGRNFWFFWNDLKSSKTWPTNFSPPFSKTS